MDILRGLDGLSERNERTSKTRRVMALAENSLNRYTGFLFDSGIFFYEPPKLADSLTAKGEVRRTSSSDSVLRNIIYSMGPE